MTILDGGSGTMLQAAGLPAGQDPCEWNLENPAAITALHRAYLEAGSEIVLANTFGANPLKYHGAQPLGEVIAAALRLARHASDRPHRVALDLGPTGRLLAPAGELPFAAAYEAFAETVRLALAAPEPPDLVFIETMGDTREVKAAVLAAKEHSALPIYVTVALTEEGRLLTGADVETYAVLMESLGVEAYGFNCGMGPDRLLPFVERLAKVSTRPIIVKPNAGLPKVVGGRTVFEVGPDQFADELSALVRAGATVIGGCCGTTPAHIERLAAMRQAAPAIDRPRVSPARISSGSRWVEFTGARALVIGERINPTGKQRLQAAYRSGDTAYILREAVTQAEAGAAVLDVNAGVPGLDERQVLGDTVEAVQAVSDLPLELDTSDPAALERALRLYNGRALVNSVNGAAESLAQVLPLVAKYGALVVALTLDEQGIPPSVEGRLAIARRILERGAALGLGRERFLFDALTMTVSTDDRAAAVTLETVRRLTEELEVKTVLGVSNVSFGLPNRVALNNAMFALAKRAGLTAAIANPLVLRDELVDGAEAVLTGRDPGCARWIANNAAPPDAAPPPPATPAASAATRLAAAVRHGLKDDAKSAAEEWLRTVAPLEVIERGIVPALELVGTGFERGTVYLPQLLMAAEAASAAFAAVRERLSRAGAATTRATAQPRRIMLATVKGDIHDIGKNIVRALLENYGYEVIDLGRDVPPEKVVKRARELGVKLVGLSALMTTTTAAMRETIAALRAADPTISTFVGGAVITAEFAAEIGATYYTRDAMASVRLAGEFFGQEARS